MITPAPAVTTLVRNGLNAREFGSSKEDNVATLKILSAIKL